jgi:phenylalanyl-tRNA synthetase beta chain
MKISLRWLESYVEIPSVEHLADQLTHAGLEVESLERLGENLAGVVVGAIVDSRPHPDAEKLSVTRVDTGGPSPLAIVCGARNYKVGDKVPVAAPGTVLPGGKRIERAHLRGVESFGMLCSAKELALSEDAAGLLILDPAAKAGEAITDALSLRDVVLAINVTPNRGDCLSHLGIAREVAALSGKPLRPPETAVTETGAMASEAVRVRVESPERCPRYAVRVIDGVRIGPSPLWMQSRLRAVGVRALGNVIDVTNYVLMELGQPLHAFDLDLVGGAEIVVRLAKAGERLQTLDGVERTLHADDLCICDASGPLALAGVMGGGTSEVTARTTRVLLEAACFTPAGIRRTARRHALHSESSHRFERGVDPGGVLFAQDRAAKLIEELARGSVRPGRVDACAKEPDRRVIALRLDRVGELLGTPVAAESTTRLLEGLGCEVKIDGASARVTVPTFRSDLERDVDLIEEVARLVGYGNIPAKMPRGAAHLATEEPAKGVLPSVRSVLSGAGLSEVVNYSFVEPRALAAIRPEPRPIALKNPLAPEQSVMRTTLLPGLLQNLGHSLRRQVGDVRLYELGRTYWPSAEEGARTPARETRTLAGLLFGARTRRQWSVPAEPVDFFDAKGVVEQVLEAAGVADVTFAPAEDEPALHPRSACAVGSGTHRLGALGELHPSACEKLDLPRGIFVFELSFEAVLAASRPLPRFRGVPRFPAVHRDLAVTVDVGVPAGNVASAMRTAGALVEDVLLFDVYRGEKLPAGKKSLAFAIRYRAADRTLTDDEANEAHAIIVARLSEAFGAVLRA